MSSAFLSQTFGRIFSANLAAKWPWNIRFDLLGVIFTRTNAVCYVPLNVSLKVFDAAVSRPFFPFGWVPVQHGWGRLTGDDSAETTVLNLPHGNKEAPRRWDDNLAKCPHQYFVNIGSAQPKRSKWAILASTVESFLLYNNCCAWHDRGGGQHSLFEPRWPGRVTGRKTRCLHYWLNRLGSFVNLPTADINQTHSGT
jgi:hypothetical protein